MTEARLPVGIEATALMRQVRAAGGFATVLRKGDADVGTLMLVLVENGANTRVYERMPTLEGIAAWSCSKRQGDENPGEITEYIARRGDQDADMWVIELDIAQAERFIR